MPWATGDGLPGLGVLTIDVAATIQRISRNASSTLSRKWRATGGRVGLPCIGIGRCIRVLRSAIRQLLVSPSTRDPDDQVADAIDRCPRQHRSSPEGTSHPYVGPERAFRG